MKIRNVVIKDFRKFKENVKFDFTSDDTSLAKNLIVITGDNRSGKSTLLEAIATTLNGNYFTLIQPSTNSKLPSVKACLEFTNSELTSLQTEYDNSATKKVSLENITFSKNIINVRWTRNKWSSPYPFKQVIYFNKNRFDFSSYGPHIISILMNEIDINNKVKELYNKVFRDISFVNKTILATTCKWFYLHDLQTDYKYTMEEMSQAEKSIFYIIFTIVEKNINNSIILIDDFDLHLHPSKQQALLRLLPLLGNNNQFIITTHSDSVTDLVSLANIIYL